MAGRLKDKAAIITGGARGMGASHASLFAREGAHVLVGDIRDEIGDRLAAGFEADGLAVRYMHLDVTKPQDWVEAIEWTEQTVGRLDILVNNAGVVGQADAATETEEGWRRIVEVNQTGVFLGMRHAIPALKRSGGGAIVNVASNLGLVGTAGYFAYQASKGAVVQMTRSAALTYAADNIRVNSVCPGLILTPMADEEGEASNATFIAGTPLGRAGLPEEVSYAVLFLASDEASYITGTELVVDGGYLAR